MPVKLNCAICGNVFFVKPSHLSKAKTCSRACKGELNRRTQSGSSNPNWKGGMVSVSCEECGKEVLTIPASVKTKKYCSRECKSKAESKMTGQRNWKWSGGREASNARRRLKRLAAKKPMEISGAAPGFHKTTRFLKIRICKSCGSPGVKKGRSYHQQCRPKPQRPKELVACLDCGKESFVYPPLRAAWKRCRPCDLASRSGYGNPNWKGGITSENHKERNSDEYKVWRKAVFERDNYTCQSCGQVGYKLHADHIKPFCAYRHLRTTVSNGRTLCETCHRKTDTYSRRVEKHQAKVNLDNGFLPFKDMGFDA